MEKKKVPASTCQLRAKQVHVSTAYLLIHVAGMSVSIFDIQGVAVIRGSLCSKHSEKTFADIVQFSPYKSRRIQAPLAVKEAEILESYLYELVLRI